MPAISEQVQGLQGLQGVEEEEARLLASLERLDSVIDSKLADAADPAAAFVLAAEYRAQQQQRLDDEAARHAHQRGGARVAPRMLPPAPALDHWNRTEDLQYFNMQAARADASRGHQRLPGGPAHWGAEAGGGGGQWYDRGAGPWGTVRSGRRPGGVQRVDKPEPAMGAAARDRRTLLRNK